jgi:hypothetical protein
MRMLVLEGAGVVIPDRAIALIEAGSPDHPAPALFELLQLQRPASATRRVLRLANGRGVEVGAEMRMVDDIAVLELSPLLAGKCAHIGVIGLAELDGELLLVCDPNLLDSPSGGRA